MNLHLLLLLFITHVSNLDASILTEWKYSKASNALSNGDYAHAQDLMRTMLVDEPTRPDLLYDLGITSFKNKEYEQASAYFNSAAASETCPPELAEQALYNLGNTCVELKQLNDAIVHYQRALELNEKNEFARHNLEVVKKMLEEQEKQDQKDQEDKQDEKNKDNDKKDQQQNKDQNQSGDKEKNKDDSSKGDDGDSDEQDSQDKNENDTSGKSGQDKKDQKNDQKDANKENNKPDDAKKEPNDQKGKGDQDRKKEKSPEQPSSAKASKGADAEKLEQQVKDDVQKNVDADQQSQKDKKNKKGDASAQSGAPKEKELDLAPEDKWILQVLDRRENEEKKSNKELMRATIDKKLAGQDGKNCW